MTLFTKSETDRLRKQTYGYQRGKVGGGWLNWEVAINIHTTI